MDPFKGFDQLLQAAAQLRAEGVELDVRIAGPPGPRPQGHPARAPAPRRRARPRRRQGRLGRRPRRGLRVRPRRRAREQAQGRERRARRGRAARADGGDGRRAARRRHRHAGHRRGDRRAADRSSTRPTAENFAKALKPYLQDPQLAARTGAKGRARVEQLMTLDRTVAELSDLYSAWPASPRYGNCAQWHSSRSARAPPPVHLRVAKAAPGRAGRGPPLHRRDPPRALADRGDHGPAHRRRRRRLGERPEQLRGHGEHRPPGQHERLRERGRERRHSASWRRSAS